MDPVMKENRNCYDSRCFIRLHLNEGNVFRTYVFCATCRLNALTISEIRDFVRFVFISGVTQAKFLRDKTKKYAFISECLTLCVLHVVGIFSVFPV